MGDEFMLRKKIHRVLLQKDMHYKKLESAHMNEVTGVVTIKWIDRYDREREDVRLYGAM